MEGRSRPSPEVVAIRVLALLVVLVAAVAAAVVAFTLPAGSDAPTAAPPTPTPVPPAGAYDLVVLGDSIGTGAGATTTYADELLPRFGADEPVAARNLARNGWTTGDLLTALRTDPRFREAVAAADLVTVTIGGNDLLQARSEVVSGTCGGIDGLDCVRSAVHGLGERWAAIADELVALSGGDAAVATITLYDPFGGAGVDPATADALAAQLDAANAAIRDAATARGFAVAPVAEAFAAAPDAGLISSDGIHPSDAGHALIADTLAGVLPAEPVTR